MILQTNTVWEGKGTIFEEYFTEIKMTFEFFSDLLIQV